jgi:hypothetical protein
VFLPLIYGEGEAYAELRLREEIQRRQEGRGIKKLQDLADMLIGADVNEHTADHAQSRHLYPSHGTNSSSAEKTSFSLLSDSSSLAHIDA